MRRGSGPGGGIVTRQGGLCDLEQSTEKQRTLAESAFALPTGGCGKSTTPGGRIPGDTGIRDAFRPPLRSKNLHLPRLIVRYVRVLGLSEQGEPISCYTTVGARRPLSSHLGSVVGSIG